VSGREPGSAGVPFVNRNPPILSDLLRDVSRSFHLTLRILPMAVRPQIGLAYLLARATDTIADTEIVPVEQRLAALDRLRSRILGRSTAALEFDGLAQTQGLPAERRLLERCEEAIAVLNSFEAGDRQRIRDVLDTITSGQELDLRRFPGSSRKAIPALASEAELIDYTFRVAGCVGEFWTKVCRSALFPKSVVTEEWLIQRGVQFGQGLQLVNILRDIPGDLRHGRCYLPLDGLAKLNLCPDDLLEPRNEIRLRPLYDHYLDLAMRFLSSGWDYTNALPRGQIRVRLACAWPILIGVRTLHRLQSGRVLDPAMRIKISRRDVRAVIFRSLLLYPFDGAWRAQMQTGPRISKTS